MKRKPGRNWFALVPLITALVRLVTLLAQHFLK